MKIGIVGTGAMGSVYAGLFGKAGHDVWAIDLWREHLDAIARNGLAVSGASGTFVVDTLSVAGAPADAGPCDLWIVATKAHDVDQATAGLGPLLRADDLVMAFQNGLGAGDRVARHVPGEQVLVGIAEGFGASIPAPGHVHHNGMRLIRIGELRGGHSDRLVAVVDLWRAAGFTVEGFADIDRMIWEKFLCNVTLSAPCAAFDVTVGELMANPDTWGVALGCAREAYEVGLAQGVTFSFEDPEEYVTEFASTIPDASPSMRLDQLAGRRSEIDVINGQVVELSREHGIDAPYNETLCAVVRRREESFS